MLSLRYKRGPSETEELVTANILGLWTRQRPQSPNLKPQARVFHLWVCGWGTEFAKNCRVPRVFAATQCFTSPLKPRGFREHSSIRKKYRSWWVGTLSNRLYQPPISFCLTEQAYESSVIIKWPAIACVGEDDTCIFWGERGSRHRRWTTVIFGYVPRRHGVSTKLAYHTESY